MMCFFSFLSVYLKKILGIWIVVPPFPRLALEAAYGRRCPVCLENRSKGGATPLVP